MARYSRDPYTLRARFASPCSGRGCERQIKPGDEIFFYPATKAAYCPECAKARRADFEAEKFDEAMLSGGFY